jgi:hypothetical protein
MRTRTKLIFAGLAATVVLSAAIGTASATRIATSEQRFRVVWRELVLSGGLALTCPVTIEGSFHSRTLSKVLEQLIGYVSAATVAEASCNGGVARILPETLPWHIRYNGFTGTLPRITEIHFRLVNAAFLVIVGGLSCLFQSTAASPMRGWIRVEPATGNVGNLRVDNTASIPLHTAPLNSFLCPGSGTLSGEGVTTAGVGGTIVVRLVA